MSRYPLMSFAIQYLDAARGKYAPTTRADLTRRYRRMAARLARLKQTGEVTTTSPQRLTPEDVKCYITCRLDENRGEPCEDLQRDIIAMRHLCSYCGNHAVESCMDRYPFLQPRVKRFRLESLNQKEFSQIVTAMAAAPDDWNHVRGYAMVMLAICTGTRTREIQTTAVADLDTSAWELYIRHPKGEGTYGEPRIVPIPPICRAIVCRYLQYRSGWAATHRCDEVPALFPAVGSQRADGGMSPNHLRQAIQIVRKESGVTFDYRKLRRTFGQRYIDSNLDLESLSVLMGHRTTKTTELYYARRRNAAAIQRAVDSWDGVDSNPKKLTAEKLTAGQGKMVLQAGFEPES